MTEETRRRKVAKRAYHLANRDKINARSKEWYDAHKEEKKIKMKAYRLAHAEEVKVQKKAYRLANKKELADWQKQYHRKHPEKLRVRCRKYRALKRGNNHEPYMGNYVFERDGWICQLCGQKINRRLKWPNPRSKSIDHIIPLSKGGSDSPINVQAAHLRCNLSKQARNGGQLRLTS